MGQTHSTHLAGGADGGPSIEALHTRLTNRFAERCYTPLELYHFKAVFRAQAARESGVRYWGEGALCRFLALPDALAAGPVLFRLAGHLGAFPFPAHAPAILTAEALLRVVTILTGRYRAVIGAGRAEWRREIYRGLAVYDRGVGGAGTEGGGGEGAVGGGTGAGGGGLAVDAAGGDDGAEDEEDDELALEAFELMDAADAFRHGEKANVHHSIIPSDNFLKLLELLLLIAPMDAQESLSTYAAQLSDERVEELRRTANSILASFGVEKAHGITYRTFDVVVSATLPYLFDSFNPLFSHFLFAKDIDLSKRKGSTGATTEKAPSQPAPPAAPPAPPPEPLLPSGGEILDLSVLSQLSFFLPPSTLFRRLRLLYSGAAAGFSMGSFEKSVFNWRAPSILLVSGTLLPASPTHSRSRAFADALPPQRLPSSTADESARLVYGAYVPTAWKATPRSCFGDASALLFQLAPQHDVFRGAAAAAPDYVYFNKPPSGAPGLGLGSAVPPQKQQPSSSSSSSSRARRNLALGPVSLHLDDALEFGVFTHVGDGGGGGAFAASPVRGRAGWQDRFAVDAVEVWGCGGSDEADAQRRAWAFEEAEAERRRRVNVGGSGDVEADRELLRMAGLIGLGQGGGSMA